MWPASSTDWAASFLLCCLFGTDKICYLMLERSRKRTTQSRLTMHWDMMVVVVVGFSYSLATDLFDLLILAGWVCHVRGRAARSINVGSGGLTEQWGLTEALSLKICTQRTVGLLLKPGDLTLEVTSDCCSMFSVARNAGWELLSAWHYC